MAEQIEAGGITFDTADLRRSIDAALKALDELEKGVQEVAENTEKSGAAFDGLGKKIAGLGLSAMVLGTVTRAYGDVKQAILGAEQADLKLNAMLKATGEQAGVTADQVEELASRISKISLFDDEKVKEASARALMFSSITSENFERVMVAATDLSAVMDRDLTGSVMQLGRALENPLLGMNLLRRAGIVFTEQEQETIRVAMKHNDVLSAQDVILKKIETRMGGVAQEMNQGLGAATVSLAKEWENLLEVFGQTPLVTDIIIPNIQGLGMWLQRLNESISPNLKVRIKSELDSMRVELSDALNKQQELIERAATGTHAAMDKLWGEKHEDHETPAEKATKARIERLRVAITALETTMQGLEASEAAAAGKTPGAGEVSPEVQKQLDQLGKAYDDQIKKLTMLPAAYEQWRISQVAAADETSYTVDQVRALARELEKTGNTKAIDDMGRALEDQIKRVRMGELAFEQWRITQVGVQRNTHFTTEQVQGLSAALQSAEFDAGELASRQAAGIAKLNESAVRGLTKFVEENPTRQIIEGHTALMVYSLQELERFAAESAQQYEMAVAPYENALGRLHSLTEATLDGTIDSFREFAASVVNILRRMVAEIAAQRIFDEIVDFGLNFGGGFDDFNPVGNASVGSSNRVQLSMERATVPEGGVVVPPSAAGAVRTAPVSRRDPFAAPSFPTAPDQLDPFATPRSSRGVRDPFSVPVIEPARVMAGAGRMGQERGMVPVQIHLSMPLTVQALDGATASEALARHAPQLQSMMLRGLETSSVMRRLVAK